MLRKRIDYFENFRNRSGCAPCDHSEAEHQLALLRPELKDLERIYNYKTATDES